MKTGEPEKLILTAYEVMTILGATQPCLSTGLKAALDEELEKPEYGNTGKGLAFRLALRKLVEHRPEVFDPENRDDAAALRLSPLFILEDGSQVSGQEILKRVEPDCLRVLTQIVDGEAVLQILAADGKEAMETTAKAKLKAPPSVDQFDVPLVHRHHAHPVDRAIEERLLRLRKQVLDATEFHGVLNFFLENFAEDAEFMGRGKPVSQAPQLRTVLRQVSRRLFPNESHQVNMVRLRHLRRHDFLHGTVTVSGRPAMVFFFQDFGFGMAAINGEGGEMHCVRLTLARKRKG